MDRAQRERDRRVTRSDHQSYLTSISGTAPYKKFETHLKRVDTLLRDLRRKKLGSANSLKMVPGVARKIFGLVEDAARYRLPVYPFHRELELVNGYIISALDVRRTTRYGGECGSYGEALLNCYLDLFITLTVSGTPREIEAKPSFLVNPVTGSTLELDVLMEDFRLAFEFQGEHHYVNPKVIGRDAFKLAECSRHQRILIPVNPFQLQSATLQRLILNSMKDHLKVGDLFLTPPRPLIATAMSSGKELLAFSKAAQRIYLANRLFAPALTWADQNSATYIANTAHRSPIASSTPAPRPNQTSPEVDVEMIYRKLPTLTRLRKTK
jgi:hypothetical protein